MASPRVFIHVPDGPLFVFYSQVDNFVECEDELSDDEDGGEENQKLNSLLEDDILSSNYSPSVLSFSKTKAVDDPSTQHPHQKVDLDDESHNAAKEICYLSGTNDLFCSWKQVSVDDEIPPLRRD